MFMILHFELMKIPLKTDSILIECKNAFCRPFVLFLSLSLSGTCFQQETVLEACKKGKKAFTDLYTYYKVLRKKWDLRPRMTHQI